MFKKMLHGIVEFFSASAEALEMERFLMGAKSPAELEARMLEWQRKHWGAPKLPL